MPLSSDFAGKSIYAAISAIEIYNKPNFAYREEAFSLLMVNAWELLLKAKWLLDHGESVEALYVFEDDGAGHQRPKVARSGNPMSHSVTYLATKLLEDADSGLEKGCHDNILALIAIRDTAAHFLTKDVYIGRRVLEVGTASLRNYLLLATEWFQLDLSQYNFFLMPISFYHGFEAAEPAGRAQYPDQIQRLLGFLDELEEQDVGEDAKQHVALSLETKLVRGKDASAVEFRWTNDPAAPAIAIREEDVIKNYPLTYRELTETMRRRYTGFVVNKEFHRLRRLLEKEHKFAIQRVLNPGNPRTPKQRFYNPNILQEFDRHYQRRQKQ